MFLFYIPHTLLIACAVLPALALLVLVYRMDRVERESPVLLARLVLMGIISTTLAKALEYAGSGALDLIFRYETPLYNALLYFVVVGVSEELSKYLVLKRATWRSPEFNCRFDGVVYAAFVSLGFALWENIGYVLMYGLGTALVRALTAVPGHACFGVFMGCWYGTAKRSERLGLEDRSRVQRALAVTVPAILHGAYDFLAVQRFESVPWLFMGFVAVLFALTVATVRRFSRQDHYI